MKKPFCLWFYGLSGAGKTTLANGLSNILHERGIVHITLDGDEFRKGVSSDLAYSEQDRSENIRRAVETVKLLLDQGVTVIASFMTPRLMDQAMVKETLKVYELTMVFVDTPINVCIQRDKKSVYKRDLNYVYGVNKSLEFDDHDLCVDGALPVNQNLTKLVGRLAIQRV